MAFPRSLLFLPAFACVFLLGPPTSGAPSGPARKVVLIGGAPSHAPGHHEHNAGVLLLQKALSGVPELDVSVHLNGWPGDWAALAGADALVIFSDGGRRHPALVDDRLETMDRILSRGAGLGLIHYAVEPTPEKGSEEFLRWIGGYFEIHRSVNPHWEAEFTSLPDHPVTRGVQPFRILDEWYFNMRFVEGMRGVTPLLAAVPPESTMERPDGTHSGNPAVRAAVARGEPQVLSWAFERAGGGRGFGFTGAHYHQNWGDPNFRKLVLNAIVWLAKAEIPPGGIESQITEADLQMNLDPKPQRRR